MSADDVIDCPICEHRSLTEYKEIFLREKVIEVRYQANCDDCGFKIGPYRWNLLDLSAAIQAHRTKI